jgi:hypothetical protein
MAHATNDAAECGTFVHRRENRFRSLRGNARAYGRAGRDLLCEGVCNGLSRNDSFAASAQLRRSAALDDRLSSYQDTLRHFERTAPELLRLFMPLRYTEPPPGYWPAKVFALGALCAGHLRQQLGEVGSGPAFLLTANIARHYGVPIYYIAPGLVEAALRTDLSPELRLTDIHWPFPALLLMLPRGSLRHPVEGDVPFIGLCRVPDPNLPATADYQPAITSVTLMPEAPTMPFYHSTQNITGLTFAGSQGMYLDGSFQSPDEAHCTDDVELARKIWNLGLALISIMTARPEYIEHGRQLKLAKARHPGELRREWWSPTYVGRVFTHSQARPPGNSDGTFHGPHRAHWVCGHVKSQVHGPRHSLRKIVWIQPYRTGAAA